LPSSPSRHILLPIQTFLEVREHFANLLRLPELGNRIRRFMGGSILEDIAAESPWERDVRMIREREAYYYSMNDDEPEAA